jgi:hypothetical protein
VSDNQIDLTLKVNADTGQLEIVENQLNKVGATAKKAEASFAGLSKEAMALARSIGLITSAVAFVSFLNDAVKGAEAQNESMRRLQFTLESTGQSWKKSQTNIQEWANTISSATRFTDSQALNTLDRLMRSTKNLSEAQQASTLAMGISARSGMDLAQATDLVNGLINKNQRAVMEAHREFGVFTEKAGTAQGVLNALQDTFGKAAFAEQGLTKESAELHNRWEQFKDMIGNALIPTVSSFLEFILNIKTHFSALAITVQTEAQKIWTLAIGITQAFQSIGKGDLAGAREAIQRTRQELNELSVESVLKINEVEQKKTEAVVKGSNERIQVTDRETQEEAAKRKELLAKVAEFEAESAQKIAALGAESLQRKNTMLNQEITARKAKINREITDETLKHKLLDKLDFEKMQRSAAMNKVEMQLEMEKTLDILSLNVQTLAILNSLGNQHNQAEVNRAKAILALEKSIAIARAIAAAMAAPPGIGQAIAAAQVALVVAQFAQQFQAIDQAQSAFKSGQSAVSVSTPLDSGQTLTDTFGPGGGNVPISVGSAPQGGGGGGFSSSGGGGGGNTTINVGGVSINFSVDRLGMDNLREVMLQLTEAVRRGTSEGVQLARTLQVTAERNSNLAV